MPAILVDWAEVQARLLLGLILAMIRRLDNVSKCKDPDCNLSDTEILDGLYLRETGKEATKPERIRYHDVEDARSTIQQAYLRMQIFTNLNHELTVIRPTFMAELSVSFLSATQQFLQNMNIRITQPGGELIHSLQQKIRRY